MIYNFVMITSQKNLYISADEKYQTVSGHLKLIVRARML